MASEGRRRSEGALRGIPANQTTSGRVGDGRTAAVAGVADELWVAPIPRVSRPHIKIFYVKSDHTIRCKGKMSIYPHYNRPQTSLAI